MKVLVACEESQRVTIELRKLGNEAYSCDLLDCSGNHPEWHIKKDVTLLLNGNCIFSTVDGVEHEISGKWDMIIAFPPCTYLTVTGNRWFNYEKYGDKAIKNLEWHHVSLSTLANIDFDMLDEKRQTYFTVYRELQETLTRLRKCKTLESYDKCLTRLMRRKNVMWARGEISNAMWHFIEVKLSMQNVESGIWGSYNEKSTGYHKSRRYNKSRA